MSEKVQCLASSTCLALHYPQQSAALSMSCIDSVLFQYLNDTAEDSGQRVSGMDLDSSCSPSREEPTVTHGGDKELLEFSAFCSELQKRHRADNNSHTGVLLKNTLSPGFGCYRENMQWTSGPKLGCGKFGSVFEVHDKKTHFKCAVKKVQLKDFKTEELEIWKDLSGPYVVELFGAILEGDFVMFFMQVANGGSLSGLIKFGCLYENVALYYFRMILDALEYLHRQGIIHNDVKGDNILLNDTTRELFLCDFSFAEKLHPGQEFIPKGRLKGRTQTHMAPEVASQEEHDTRADVWSATCTLLHMMNARHPWIKEYNHLPSLDIVIAKHSPPLFEIPKGCHDDARRLIERGLTVNPQERPQAAALRDEVHAVLLNLGYPSPSCFENNIKKLQSSPPESFGPPPSVSTTEPSFTLNTPPPLPQPPEGEEKKEPKHVPNVCKTSMWDAKSLECGVTRMRKESEKENSEIIKAFHRDRLSTCNSEDLEEWLEMVETAETWLDDDVLVPTDTS